MWIGAELPQELVSAHQSGDLVIFVGAGASIAPPSNLPDFRGLAEAIAADAGVAFGKDDPLDVVLGKADAPANMDVHQRVAERIDDPASRPNRLHRAIGKLAKAGPVVRVVTTNYDRHLSKVLGRKVPEYRAPALPLGDDFEGIVYLHGTLGQDPRHLIATDEDFGAAYLLDGWAVRFLERMFRRYTVLFVGYSHNDFAMTYLGRALPPSTRRFALTEDTAGQAEHWRRFRVVPVPYPNPDKKHTQLPIMIGEWAELAGMSLLDHRRRVAQLTAGSPTGIPEEDSYLEDVLADEDKSKFFAEYARGPHWLAWATERTEFKRLFHRNSSPSPLAGWFAEHYVADESLSQKALEALENCGGRLGPHLWSAIGRRLHTIRSPRPPWLARWLVLLIRDDPGGYDWLEYALAASRLPADRDVALMLFAHLTTPSIDFHHPRRPRLGASFELTIRGDVDSLLDTWSTVFVPELPQTAAEVLAIADAQLRQAYRLTSATYPGRFWDLESRQRFAIEPHAQNSFHRPLDILIDACRDSVKALLDSGSAAAVQQLNAWEAEDHELPRRLAVHGWTHRGDVTATAKLEWLRERGWLLEHGLWHEIAVLIQETAGAADMAVLEGLISDVGKASADAATEHEKANVLAWIARHAAELKSAATAAYPDFRPGKYPDFHRWSEGGFVPDRPPTTVPDLHARIDADPVAAIAYLKQFETKGWSYDETSWDDASRLLRQTVAEHPRDGFALIGAGDEAISGAVVRGWSEAALDAATAEEVVRRLDGATHAREVAAMLSGFGRSSEGATVWRDVPGGRDLADRTWRRWTANPPRNEIVIGSAGPSTSPEAGSPSSGCMSSRPNGKPAPTAGRDCRPR
ncbi:SIR2 family protein [Actinoplanes sp. NPDC089786]|uniref:SIR2 family protein n=1 Tax=Actinoplanes sp. NPDC089786 TaxID=3155185 RepID=UPI00341275E8